MKLNMDGTRFVIEEQVVESVTLSESPGIQTGAYWTAELDGESSSGEAVRMSRNGKTPDEALDNLFDAMHEAKITL